MENSQLRLRQFRNDFAGVYAILVNGVGNTQSVERRRMIGVEELVVVMMVRSKPLLMTSAEGRSGCGISAAVPHAGLFWKHGVVERWAVGMYF